MTSGSPIHGRNYTMKHKLTMTLLLTALLLPLAAAPARAQRGTFAVQAVPPLTGTLVGTWDVSISIGGVLLTQKWVLAADGQALMLPTYPWAPTYASATWRRNNEYLQLIDDLGGREELYRCTLSGDTFSLVPVDRNGQRRNSQRYIGERRR